MQMPTDVTTLQLVFLVSGEHLGRRRLARRTGFSEMTVRLALERLRNEGHLNLDKAGAILTELGRELFSPVLHHVKRIREITLHSLAQDRVTLTALLSLSATKSPWWYRDLAIKEGASAAVIIQCRSDGLYFFHTCEQISVHNPYDNRVIETVFPSRQEGNLLVIVTAPDRKSAGRALWRVIGEVLSESR